MQIRLRFHDIASYICGAYIAVYDYSHKLVTGKITNKPSIWCQLATSETPVYPSTYLTGTKEADYQDVMLDLDTEFISYIAIPYFDRYVYTIDIAVYDNNEYVTIGNLIMPVCSDNIEKYKAKEWFRSADLDFGTIPSSNNIDPEANKHRLNSNIYKNLFPELPFDLEAIQRKMESTVSSFSEICQENHGFSVGNVLYYDEDNDIYGKAIASDAAKRNVVGMVTRVSSSNVFTLMKVGIYPYMHLPYKDTTILYLSDRVFGGLCHYLDLYEPTYIPVGIYANDSVILNIQDGITGVALQPYDTIETFFEAYDKEELDEVVEVVLNGTS